MMYCICITCKLCYCKSANITTGAGQVGLLHTIFTIKLVVALLLELHTSTATSSTISTAAAASPAAAATSTALLLALLLALIIAQYRNTAVVWCSYA